MKQSDEIIGPHSAAEARLVVKSAADYAAKRPRAVLREHRLNEVFAEIDTSHQISTSTKDKLFESGAAVITAAQFSAAHCESQYEICDAIAKTAAAQICNALESHCPALFHRIRRQRCGLERPT